jgi:hypothetical protein
MGMGGFLFAIAVTPPTGCYLPSILPGSFCLDGIPGISDLLSFYFYLLFFSDHSDHPVPLVFGDLSPA